MKIDPNRNANRRHKLNLRRNRTIQGSVAIGKPKVMSVTTPEMTGGMNSLDRENTRQYFNDRIQQINESIRGNNGAWDDNLGHIVDEYASFDVEDVEANLNELPQWTALPEPIRRVEHFLYFNNVIPANVT